MLFWGLSQVVLDCELLSLGKVLLKEMTENSGYAQFSQHKNHNDELSYILIKHGN